MIFGRQGVLEATPECAFFTFSSYLLKCVIYLPSGVPRILVIGGNILELVWWIIIRSMAFCNLEITWSSKWRYFLTWQNVRVRTVHRYFESFYARIKSLEILTNDTTGGVINFFSRNAIITVLIFGFWKGQVNLLSWLHSFFFFLQCSGLFLAIET